MAPVVNEIDVMIHRQASTVRVTIDSMMGKPSHGRNVDDEGKLFSLRRGKAIRGVSIKSGFEFFCRHTASCGRNVCLSGFLQRRKRRCIEECGRGPGSISFHESYDWTRPSGTTAAAHGAATLRWGGPGTWKKRTTVEIGTYLVGAYVCNGRSRAGEDCM
ncbi:uncharacterized protein LY79DRAFT_80034 [Colletotrichum navitas]|uniref:Uncharacterized protein n=1 Tax=Colletotrichum navitas TaxID=681940 RepID=A0AAD8Q587_9PEZI|nr:uncharacterized protein LY79DRAFT_80034 [Colletotrichum navitas]KAK1596115.1 hypothetical protein LY79DRAFT_80034 [Colletotrichum navitas]